MWIGAIFCLLICLCLQTSSSWTTRPLTTFASGRGSTDDSPVYLTDNYIPAAMHIMFYLSDSMKYDVRPTPGAVSSSPSISTTTTTTVRPTLPHRPGYYAPVKPPALVKPPTPVKPPTSALDTYYPAWSYGWGNIRQLPEVSKELPEGLHRENLSEDIDLLGAGPSELLQQINSLDDDTIGDDDDQIEKFFINYADTVDLDFLRQKKIPPTRAYVNVLSLYDTLNREAKELGLNKYNGYSTRMLHELSKTSQGSSSEQFKFALRQIVQKRNTQKEVVLRKVKQMLSELEKPDSYINNAIKYIPAFQFSLERCN